MKKTKILVENEVYLFVRPYLSTVLTHSHSLTLIDVYHHRVYSFLKKTILYSSHLPRQTTVIPKSKEERGVKKNRGVKKKDGTRRPE